MLRTILAVILALAVSAAGAQIVNRPIGAGAISNPGTALPSTCAVGYLYFKSDSTAGQNLHLCTASNTWTQMTGGNLANPVTVLQGGTGRATSTTAYGLLAAGTTATGTQQTLAAGATTDILVGGGASALPAWTTATGSGAPVRATTPTLVTPVLGAATATSINFGGTTLSTFVEGTFTPTVVGTGTAGTATYTSQQGWYARIGNTAIVWIDLTWSSGTGTGNLNIGALPLTAKNSTTWGYACAVMPVTLNAGDTTQAAFSVNPNATTIYATHYAAGAQTAIVYPAAGRLTLQCTYPL